MCPPLRTTPLYSSRMSWTFPLSVADDWTNNDSQTSAVSCLAVRLSIWIGSVPLSIIDFSRLRGWWWTFAHCQGKIPILQVVPPMTPRNRRALQYSSGGQHIPPEPPRATLKWCPEPKRATRSSCVASPNSHRHNSFYFHFPDSNVWYFPITCVSFLFLSPALYLPSHPYTLHTAYNLHDTLNVSFFSTS